VIKGQRVSTQIIAVQNKISQYINLLKKFLNFSKKALTLTLRHRL